MRLEIVAEPHRIEGNDFPALSQKLRDESRALVTTGPGDQNLHLTPLKTPGMAGTAKRVGCSFYDRASYI
jgi:hypothetical protein